MRTRRYRLVPIVATALVGLFTQPLHAAAIVNITMFSQGGASVPPNTRLHLAGNAGWTASSIDTIDVRVWHSKSGQITDSMGVMVMKYPPPATFGTWDTLNLGPYAKTATTHNSGDTYFVEAEG